MPEPRPLLKGFKLCCNVISKRFPLVVSCPHYSAFPRRTEIYFKPVLTVAQRQNRVRLKLFSSSNNKCTKANFPIKSYFIIIGIFILSSTFSIPHSSVGFLSSHYCLPDWEFFVFKLMFERQVCKK